MYRVILSLMAVLVFASPAHASPLVQEIADSVKYENCGVHSGSPHIHSNIGKKCPTKRNRSAATAAIKAAIRYALKNRNQLIKIAEDSIGKQAAKKIRKKMDKAEPVLTNLLKYDELVWGMIEGHLANVVGRDVAFWIRLCLQWISPV